MQPRLGVEVVPRPAQVVFDGGAHVGVVDVLSGFEVQPAVGIGALDPPDDAALVVFDAQR